MSSEIARLRTSIENLEKTLRIIWEIEGLCADFFPEKSYKKMCLTCGINWDESTEGQCPACGSETLVRVLYLQPNIAIKNRNNTPITYILDDNPIYKEYEMYNLSSEMVKLLEVFVTDYKVGLARIQQLLDKFEPLKEISNSQHTEEDKSKLFLYLLLRSNIIEEAKDLILQFLSIIEKNQNEINVIKKRYAKGSKIQFAPNDEYDYNKLFLKLIKLGKPVLAEIMHLDDSLKRVNVTSDDMNFLKQRSAVTVNVAEHVPHVTGKVTIIVRHYFDHQETFNILCEYIKLIDTIVRKYGSLKEYFEKLTQGLEKITILILQQHTQLFTAVWGSQLNFSLGYNIHNISASAFAGKVIQHVFKKHSGASVSQYDAANKTLDMSIDDDLAFELVNGELEYFTKVVVHELNHVVDKQLPKRNESSVPYVITTLRTEGIAVFSEFVYTKKVKDFNTIIQRLTKTPINSLAECIALLTEDPTDLGTPMVSYQIGPYMCLVIYFALLKRKYLSVQLDPMRSEDIKAVLADERLFKEAEVTLRILRNIPQKEFFVFYQKYSQELGLQPIFTDNFIAEISSV